MLKEKNRVANILSTIQQRQKKSLAVLLDPDKVNLNKLTSFVQNADEFNIDFIFIGGSLITDYKTKEIIDIIRSQSDVPVILFPGSALHIETSADAILLLSLISGRNPDFLIGQHVTAAPLLKRSQLEIISTGYMLIDSGKQTTVSYISNTTPIPADKPDIAACTAMAGEMLGLKQIFLDAGSGAINPVSPAIIKAVRKNVDIPVLVGGGINTSEKARSAWEAGADVVVVGNAFETNPELLFELASTCNNLNASLLQ